MSLRVAVVPMRSRHVRGVVAIEQLTSPRPWSKDLFASELKQASSRGFVATRPDSSVAGFACLMSTGHEVHVTNLAVDPTLRRHGIATLLMLRLVAETQTWGFDDMTLEVRESNEPAKALYRRFGFEEEGVRPRYYAETGEDAIIMWVRGVGEEPYRRRIDEIVATLTPSSDNTVPPDSERTVPPDSERTVPPDSERTVPPDSERTTGR